MSSSSSVVYPFLFIVEYYDPLPRLKRQYLLKYWGPSTSHGNGSSNDNGFVEMTDIKTKKLFLKKSPVPETISPSDMIINAKIFLYGRELQIVEFGDGKTRSTLGSIAETCVVVLPPETYSQWGQYIDDILRMNQKALRIQRIKTIQLSQSATDFLVTELHLHRNLSSSLVSGVSCVISFIGINAIQSISAYISEAKLGNIIYSHSDADGQAIDAVVDKIDNSCTLDNCTCVIIKPHCVKGNYTGEILSMILKQGYDVSAITSVSFTKVQAEEFLEVYRGVIPDFSDHVVELSSGTAIAMEVRSETAVETFRLTAGPWDIEIAKTLRPESLRSLYGINKVQSGIHCTDLVADGVPEVEYVFKILV